MRGFYLLENLHHSSCTVQGPMSSVFIGKKEVRVSSDVQLGDTIVVWFSNGAASAVALLETIRRYGSICDIRAVNNPVAEEDEDNLRFHQDVARWLGITITTWSNPDWPTCSAEEVWERRKAMSFPLGAPCTTLLKKGARQDYERAHNIDWHGFGFTADEAARHNRFVLTERENVLPVLIEANITKKNALKF